MHLTTDQIEDFIHLLHPIPVAKGYLHEWLEENAPGYTSRRLAAELLDEGLVDRAEPGEYPPLVLTS
jgi:hypothetical protein